MRIVIFVLAICVLGGLHAVPAAALPNEQVEMPDECIFEDGELGRYIVVFHDWVFDPEYVARRQVERYDGVLGFVYKSALKGYSAQYLPASAAALQAEPTVDYIEVSRLIWMDESSGVIQWRSCPMAPPLGPPPPPVIAEEPETPSSQRALENGSPSPVSHPGPTAQSPALPRAGHCRKLKVKRAKRCTARGSRDVRICEQRAVARRHRC